MNTTSGNSLPTLPALGTLFHGGQQTLRPSQGPTATISVTGDISGIRGVEESIREHGANIFQGIAELLKSDWVLGNLETPVSRNAERDPIRGAFTSDPDIMAPIFDLGFHGFNIANNHTMDYGVEGLQETLAELTKRGLQWTGAGMNLEEAEKPIIHTVNGLRFGLLAWSQPEIDNATEQTPGVAPLRRERVLKAVKALRPQVDILIVSLHEGYEFQFYPRLEFMDLCRELIDEGVDFLWGNHPHVIQGMETRGNGLIMFSVGNFLFDMQYHRQKEGTRDTLIPHLTFDAQGICGIELRCAVLGQDCILRVAEASDRQRIFNKLEQTSKALQDRERIRTENRKSVEEVFSIVMDAVYQMGKDNNPEALQHFLKHQFRRDPYLKVFRDFGELIGNYVPLSSE